MLPCWICCTQLFRDEDSAHCRLSTIQHISSIDYSAFGIKKIYKFYPFITISVLKISPGRCLIKLHVFVFRSCRTALWLLIILL